MAGLRIANPAGVAPIHSNAHGLASTWPLHWRSAVTMFLGAIILYIVNDATMSVAYIRHRWRTIFFAGRTIGLTCSLFFVFFGPSDLCFCGIAYCICFSFVDPRLHSDSFARDPNPLAIKSAFALGALLHHVGGMFVVSDVFHGLARVPGARIVDAPILLNLTVLLEFVGWLVDCAVITRRAPKWFFVLNNSKYVIQTATMVLTIVFVGGIDRVATYVTSAGNCMMFIGANFGLISTHEIDPKAAPLSRKSMRRGSLKEGNSVARMYNQAHPLSWDDTMGAHREKLSRRVSDWDLTVDGDAESLAVPK